MQQLRWCALVGAGFAAASSLPARAERETVATSTFAFAPVGLSYLAIMTEDDPRVGSEVIAARIFLFVEADPGSNAANFFTDLGLPIETAPGEGAVVFLTGDALGWTGDGSFEYIVETEALNGQFVPSFYAASTPGFDFSGRLLEGSRVEVDYLFDGEFPIGDLNCDGIVSVGDISGLVLAITDPAGYAAQFPDCDIRNADLNDDGAITVGDIGPFVSRLTGF